DDVPDAGHDRGDAGADQPLRRRDVALSAGHAVPDAAANGAAPEPPRLAGGYVRRADDRSRDAVRLGGGPDLPRRSARAGPFRQLWPDAALDLGQISASAVGPRKYLFARRNICLRGDRIL